MIKILNLDKESEYARLEKQRLVDIKRTQEKTSIKAVKAKKNEEAQII